MPRPRARLDLAAIAVAFAPDGVHGVSAAEVARVAGIAKPTLYVHGRSKESVFLACVEAEVERLLDRLYRAEQLSRDRPLAARAAAQAVAVLDHARAHPEAGRLLHLTARHASSSVAAEVDAALARIPARVAEALRRDRPDADGDAAVAAAVALVGAAAALALAPTADARAVAERIGEALADQLDAAPAPTDADADAVTSIGIY